MAIRGEVMAKIFTMMQGMTFNAAINGSMTWVTTERKLRLWGDVPSEQQPYCALVTHLETGEYRGLGLQRTRLNLMFYCYSRAGDGVNGQEDLDVMAQAFDDTFGANAVDNFSTNQNTLGGLVYYCRLDGKVFKDPGDIDKQTLLLIPLLVELP